jgi:pimeloyl-ACP methyl ester carboxylesterase
MREEGIKVVPALEADTLGAITYGDRLEPVTKTYTAIAAAGLPVLLVYAARARVEELVKRFRTALPGARVEAIPDAIHDLVSFAPEKIARVVGEFVTRHRRRRSRSAPA